MRLLSGCVCVLLLLLSSCSKKEEMKALMEQTLQEDQQEVVFRSDSTALLLIDYFIQHGTANEQMRAYYLLGRAYDCKRNPVLALRFYQEAIEKADTSASDIDYVTLSRAYAHSSKLFNGNFDRRPTLAIEEGKKALCYAQLSNNEHMQKICRSLLGRAFFSLGLWDSVRVYDSSFYMRLFRWWEKQQPDYLTQYHSFLPLSSQVSKKNEEVYVGYEIPLDSIPQAMRGKRGYITGGGAYHAKEKASDRDSIMNLSNISSFVDMRLQSQAKSNRLNNYLILTTAILLMALIAAYFYSRLKREKDRQTIKALNMQYSLDLAKYHVLQSEMQLLMAKSKDKDEDIRQRQEQIKELQQKLTSLQGDRAHPSVWHLADKMLSNELIGNLHRKASVGQKADRSDIASLKALTFQTDPVFLTTLSECNPTLQTDNMLICILTRFRFLPSELAVLLDKSPQVITNRKARLLKRLFKKNGGARQFDQQILSI